MYKILRNFLFIFPAETAHSISMNMMKWVCSVALFRKWMRKWFFPGYENTTVFGLTFRNRIGLGAGFDKNAMYLRELEILGFGFVEIGTVTPKPQAGNDKPRLFRLKKDKALINRMGFNNDGVEAVAERLKRWRNSSIVNRQSSIVNRESSMEDSQIQHLASSATHITETRSHSRLTSASYAKASAARHDSRLLIGGNIGKNKSTPNEEAWKDYEICFTHLYPYVDFFVVNVSSPNTPGLRALQEKDSLRKILVNIQQKNKQLGARKPILLKIAPDLEFTAIDDVIDLAKEIQLDGIVAANTTISRNGLSTDKNTLEKIGAGGLSGLPLKEKSSSIVQYIYSKLNGSIPIIASGGVFNAQDANEKFKSGANLVEVWTGFIYEGPFIVKRILSNQNKQ